MGTETWRVREGSQGGRKWDPTEREREQENEEDRERREEEGDHRGRGEEGEQERNTGSGAMWVGARVCDPRSARAKYSRAGQQESPEGPASQYMSL